MKHYNHTKFQDLILSDCCQSHLIHSHDHHLGNTDGRKLIIQRWSDLQWHTVQAKVNKDCQLQQNLKGEID